MSKSHQTQYTLRNNPSDIFDISAEVTKSGKSGADGAEITAQIKHVSGHAFCYKVEFGGEFAETKENFTPEMYLHTAISIMQSQLESKRYEDTLLKVHRHSGLTDTSPLGKS